MNADLAMVLSLAKSLNYLERFADQLWREKHICAIMVK
jgi:hypothetical protein